MRRFPAIDPRAAGSLIFESGTVDSLSTVGPSRSPTAESRELMTPVSSEGGLCGARVAVRDGDPWLSDVSVVYTSPGQSPALSRIQTGSEEGKGMGSRESGRLCPLRAARVLILALVHSAFGCR